MLREASQQQNDGVGVCIEHTGPWQPRGSLFPLELHSQALLLSRLNKVAADAAPVPAHSPVHASCTVPFQGDFPALPEPGAGETP